MFNEKNVKRLFLSANINFVISLVVLWLNKIKKIAQPAISNAIRIYEL